MAEMNCQAVVPSSGSVQVGAVVEFRSRGFRRMATGLATGPGGPRFSGAAVSSAVTGRCSRGTSGSSVNGVRLRRAHREVRQWGSESEQMQDGRS